MVSKRVLIEGMLMWKIACLKQKKKN